MNPVSPPTQRILEEIAQELEESGGRESWLTPGGVKPGSGPASELREERIAGHVANRTFRSLAGHLAKYRLPQFGAPQAERASLGRQPPPGAGPLQLLIGENRPVGS
jgi:hypothetical protein